MSRTRNCADVLTSRPEREDAAAREETAQKPLRRVLRDGVLELVMFAIIVTTAATLGKHGKHNIQSATEASWRCSPRKRTG